MGRRRRIEHRHRYVLGGQHLREVVNSATVVDPLSALHQILIHGSSLRDGGCTEEDPPNREEDLAAEKLHFGRVSAKL